MNVEQTYLKPLAGGASVQISGEVLIGRSEDCDLVLKGGYPSRKHARLFFREGAARLEDLGSSNGTFVNGERITGAVALKHGDRVRFDILEFDFLSAPVQADMTQLRSLAGRTEVRRPPETARPVEAARPPETARPQEAARPAEPVSPAEAARPEKAAKPQEAGKPAQVPGPPEAARPAEAARPQEAGKPAEAPRPQEAGKPAEAATSAEAARPGAAPRPAAPAGPAPRKPGAWVDPDAHPEGGTKFLTREEIEALRTQSAPPGAGKKIDHPCLEVCSGQSRGQQLKLETGGGQSEWGVGSDAEREIVLGDEGVSAYHAKIVHLGKTWKLIDQMSANGTWVNGRKASISYLNPGDRIKFGPVECVFHAPATTRQSTGRGKLWGLVVAILIAMAIGFVALWRWLDW